jgi:NDP-sugar pyrophosphorylase family protein
MNAHDAQSSATPSMPMPTAVILAGGKGTRLRPFTITFPKPLVPIGDMPILAILLRRLHGGGVRRVVLTLGHLAELIRAYISQHVSGSLAGIDVSYVTEAQPTGTAGSLSLVPGLNDTFLAMNGDLLTNIDFRALVRHHKASGAELTIASHVNRVKIDLGVLALDASGRLVNYVEKPEKEYHVSMGIYVYEPSVLDLIPKGEYLDFPDLVLKLLKQGRKISVYPFDGLWLDIGRPDDYARAQQLYETNPEIFIAPPAPLLAPAEIAARERPRP